MQFRTELHLAENKQLINHQCKLLSIGSCFSHVVGNYFEENKFDVLSNPFGTIFNPISIFNLLEASLSENGEKVVLPVETKNGWYNYAMHSNVYATSEKELVSLSEQLLSTTHAKLKQCDFLFITFGSAFGYRKNDTKKLVANCHKVGATEFTKELLSVEQIKDGFNSFYNKFQSINPKCNIILTVSPVRHTKDTLPLNSLSKSTLIVASYEIIQDRKAIGYFPSYEMVMDDLRDYRFYKEDLIHPNLQAERYILEKFSQVYFDNETKKIVEEWQILRKGIMHKPFQEKSEEHIKFLNNLYEKLRQLNKKIPLEAEINQLSERINALTK